MAWPAKALRRMKFRGMDRQTFMLEVVPGSPTYSFDGQRGSANTSWWIKWDGDNTNIPLAVTDFLGYSKTIPLNGKIDNKYFINRNIPFEHPNFKDFLFADSIQTIKGDVPARYGPTRDINDVVEHDLANFNVIFATKPYRILTDAQLMNNYGLSFPDESKLLRYVSATFTPTTKVQKIPSGNAFKWVGTPFPATPPGARTPASNIGNVSLVEADVVITHYQVPVGMIPWGPIYDASQGRTNEDVVGSPTGALFIPENKLLYLGAKVSTEYRMSNGELAVDIAHQMRWFPFGPNCFLRWDATQVLSETDSTVVTRPAFQLVTRTGFMGLTNPRLYPPYKYNRLFWGPGQIDTPS